LYENIDDVAILIHSAPEVLALTVDRDEEFVQEPRVAKPALTTFQPTGVLGSEFDRPLSDGFISHIHTPFNEHFFDFPKTETESIIKPDGVADNLGRKTVPNVSGTYSVHPDILPCGNLT
jgi:hypothetical protein